MDLQRDSDLARAGRTARGQRPTSSRPGTGSTLRAGPYDVRVQRSATGGSGRRHRRRLRDGGHGRRCDLQQHWYRQCHRALGRRGFVGLAHLVRHQDAQTGAEETTGRALASVVGAYTRLTIRTAGIHRWLRPRRRRRGADPDGLPEVREGRRGLLDHDLGSHRAAGYLGRLRAHDAAGPIEPHGQDERRNAEPPVVRLVLIVREGDRPRGAAYRNEIPGGRLTVHHPGSGHRDRTSCRREGGGLNGSEVGVGLVVGRADPAGWVRCEAHVEVASDGDGRRGV